jgi:hypothetical protein
MPLTAKQKKAFREIAFAASFSLSTSAIKRNFRLFVS